MPVVLAIVITSVQNSTFELVNENKIPLLLYNKDGKPVSQELEAALDKVGMFNLHKLPDIKNTDDLKSRINKNDASVAIVIPELYSEDVERKEKAA